MVKPVIPAMPGFCHKNPVGNGVKLHRASADGEIHIPTRQIT
jgi:hypothetical protein